MSPKQECGRPILLDSILCYSSAEANPIMASSGSCEDLHDQILPTHCEYSHHCEHRDWDHHHCDSSWNDSCCNSACSATSDAVQLHGGELVADDEEEVEALLVVRDRGKGGAGVTSTNLDQQAGDGVIV